MFYCIIIIKYVFFLDDVTMLQACVFLEDAIQVGYTFTLVDF